MDQRQWISRALEGDRTARAHLFEESIQPIYYLCWKLTGSAAQAGELTRRTFARAFSNLSELRPDASFERWVTAIAVNLCRQTMKKAQPWLFTTDEREMAILSDAYVAEEECLPPECATDPNVRVQALRTVSLLPPEQRVAMVLRYAALMKPHQIAKVMDVDEVTILGRLNSGRRALMTALPSDEPQALITALFANEATSLPVPEIVHGSCLQTVLNTQPGTASASAPAPAPEPAPAPKSAPAPEPEPEEELDGDGEKEGFFARLTKKQKAAFYGGIAAAALLLLLLLAFALRGCGKTQPEDEPQIVKPEPAPVEEIDENLEAAAQLKEYGVEMLLTCNRREADELMDSWRDVLPDYVSGGDLDDLDLNISTANNAVNEVRLSLEKTDLDITRLKELGLGSEPEIEAAAKAINSRYGLYCYRHTPLFDPSPLQTSSLGAYSENYRYELLDENGDGRAEALSITRTGAGYDPDLGVFRPYGTSLSELLGAGKSEAEELFGEGSYEGDGVDVYTMTLEGATADDSKTTVSAVMQARTDMDAAHGHVSAITLRTGGCFGELLGELQLPDTALTLDQLNRKLQAIRGHVGQLEGDIFRPLIYEEGQEYLYYYNGATRYCFGADSGDSKIRRVEVLDLSDCKLWNASSLSFRQDGFDLEELIGLDRYQAYEKFGIQSYAAEGYSASGLGLWEAQDAIRTVYNAADPRALWGLRLGDSRESIESKIEKDGGYLVSEENGVVRYVLSGKRELVVTYADGKAKILQLEDHSFQSGYQPPERPRKSAQEQYREFLDGQSDVKSSWFGDLTGDGEGDLLVCRSSSSGCLVQLYVLKDGEMSQTPIYSQSLSASSSTDLYLVRRDSGPALLYYTLSETPASRRCSWRLVSVNGGGSEVVLQEGDASVNLLDMLLGGQEEYDETKKTADGLREGASFLCGTQSGEATFGDAKADLSE